jgi:hypothetical protein
MLTKIEELGDRLLTRLVPRARALAQGCTPANPGSGCSLNYCGYDRCRLGLRRWNFQCCYNNPPPRTCTSCGVYFCLTAC